MREIHVDEIKKAVAELCLKANFELRKDVLRALKQAVAKETDARAKGILKSIVENAAIARKKRIAICQDTGMATVFIEMGYEVAVRGGDIYEAVDEGVKEAYRKGYLRMSVVDDPLLRKNTNTNTPAMVHIDMVAGDRMRIVVSPKGFGSENKSAIKMFRPTQGADDIKDFVLETVKNAGPDACPPLVLGVGIGGTFEKAALLAKKALLRPIDEKNPAKHLARLEKELIAEINALKIGPMGLGGKATVLGVNVMSLPTHIAGLPVAVNVSCHATRSAERIL